MNARPTWKKGSFNTLLSRRGALGRLGAYTAGILGVTGTSASAQARQPTSSVSIPCVPCACEGDVCGCCIIGFTGGGVVQMETGEAQVIVFATRLEEGTSQQGTGFVRWIDDAWNGQVLTLESQGPITYEPAPDEERARDIRGVMQANGEGEHAFHLRVVDYGADNIGQDTAELRVGQGFGAASTFTYQAKGQLIGGDFQLLDSVAPVMGA